MTTTGSGSAGPFSPHAVGSLLRPAEWLLFGLVVALGLGSVALALTQGRQVAWSEFALGILAALGMIVLGVYARRYKASPRLGLCAIGVGLFMSFCAFAAIFIFSLFPLPHPLVDSGLMAVDAQLGYDWGGFVRGLAEYPALGIALGRIYDTALVQVALLIVILGLMGRETDLHRMLLVGMAALGLAVGCWWLWPSIGPAAYIQIAAETAARIHLVVDSEYGAKLVQLVERGPDRIGPDTIIGVVAFPSYHMVMALLVAWYSYRTMFFGLFALASLAMIPATLSHGGHHLVDVLAAVVLFLFCEIVARRMISGKADGAI
ncbi:hypothetical protein GCM10007315_06380 [Gemmobacter tilapiae]|uniref:Inositolphosphotransferase Aur1/Ipt1 domain-containing protein n=2 Tax=Neogemmobacter tilapiae TaxID=875041 RepID=A0A918TGP7_9RHOB|nr:hypothetical protein GCM10007315_06380 [Gemmobacter tilapiae]